MVCADHRVCEYISFGALLSVVDHAGIGLVRQWTGLVVGLGRMLANGLNRPGQQGCDAGVGAAKESARSEEERHCWHKRSTAAALNGNNVQRPIFHASIALALNMGMVTAVIRIINNNVNGFAGSDSRSLSASHLFAHRRQ